MLRSRRHRGHHRLAPYNFCERHPAKWRGAFCYARTLWFYDARIFLGGRRPPGDETACGLRKSPYSGNYRRYRTPPAYYERPKRRGFEAQAFKEHNGFMAERGFASVDGQYPKKMGSSRRSRRKGLPEVQEWQWPPPGVETVPRASVKVPEYRAD